MIYTVMYIHILCVQTIKKGCPICYSDRGTIVYNIPLFTPKSWDVNQSTDYFQHKCDFSKYSWFLRLFAS